MRRPQFIATSALGALAIMLIATTAEAATVANSDEAADVVRSDGFKLVTKAEPVPGAWDVWASKDGIAYEVKVDANSGSVVNAVPVEDND